ncbi:hypothetical protein ACFW16_19425 [Inquilinus sp. NPDC058860]|uniref:hypothetical protein n=1 Tax=Inquilinus sp. NPDC058860 TaxID=3346652 RepID=UPI00367EFE70
MTTIQPRTEPLDGVRPGPQPDNAAGRPIGPVGAPAPRRAGAARGRRDRASRLREEVLDYIRPVTAGSIHATPGDQAETLADILDLLQAEAPDDRLARWGSAVLLQELRKHDLLRARLNDLIGG